MKISGERASFDLTLKTDSALFELRYISDQITPEIDERVHDFYEFIYFVEGAPKVYEVGDKRYQVKPNDMLLVPPGVVHRPLFEPDAQVYKRYVLQFSSEFLKKLEQLDKGLLEIFHHCESYKEYLIRYSAPALAPNMERYLRAMWKELQGEAPCKFAYAYSLCITFLMRLNRIFAVGRILSFQGLHRDTLLNQVVEYIQENYASPITLASVAEHFFVSPSTIEQLLCNQLGTPFKRYVTQCRIVRAQVLIAHNVPLKMVSQMCGYNDYTTFYKAFVGQLGISPSEYRLHQPLDRPFFDGDF